MKTTNLENLPDPEISFLIIITFVNFAKEKTLENQMINKGLCTRANFQSPC